MSNIEPKPKPGKIVVWETVYQDIHSIVGSGFEKYGTFLQTHNGRDALRDAYQKAIDLAMYLRQSILERDNDTTRT